MTALQNIRIQDVENTEERFEPISVVQHQGVLRRDGTSSGHYTADVKNQALNQCYNGSSCSYQSLNSDKKRLYLPL